jgi:hypothetical protein
MEVPETLSSQGNLKQKEERWRYLNMRLQILLQSHSNKKQVDTGTKSDTKINGLERRTRNTSSEL